MRRKSVIAAIILCVFASVSTVHALPRKITILHINDTHGHLDPFVYNGTNIGGAARIATLVKAIRASNDAPVLFFHTGDTLSRGDAMTVVSGGAANLAVLDALGCDAYIPGNGDFYGGADDLLRFSRLAKTPFLGANITFISNGARLFPPYIITNIGGIRTALLGLCFIRLENPGSKGLAMQNAVDCAQTLCPELAANDLIVALTHIGFDEDRRLASNAAINVIIGGHSHTVISPAYTMSGIPASSNTVLIAQAGEHYAYLGRVDIVVDTAGNASVPPKVTATGTLIPVDEHIPEDPATLELLLTYRTMSTETLATAVKAFPHNPKGESPAGVLAASAIMSEMKADAAIIDRGSITGGLAPGPVTFTGIVRMHPWRSGVIVLSLSGKQLRAAASRGDMFASIPQSIDDAVLYTVTMTEFAFSRIKDIQRVPYRTEARRMETLIADHVRRVKTLE
ncbi:MAG: bifunctional metallophosphatase/5'-nucleotidase [Spirochaetes bacterium]|nr:bifunctional metallophosphatase/5'-nucleotidase [Spirochaetota bacterium]